MTLNERSLSLPKDEVPSHCKCVSCAGLGLPMCSARVPCQCALRACPAKCSAHVPCTWAPQKCVVCCVGSVKNRSSCIMFQSVSSLLPSTPVTLCTLLPGTFGAYRTACWWRSTRGCSLPKGPLRLDWCFRVCLRCENKTGKSITRTSSCLLLIDTYHQSYS